MSFIFKNYWAASTSFLTPPINPKISLLLQYISFPSTHPHFQSKQINSIFGFFAPKNSVNLALFKTNRGFSRAKFKNSKQNRSSWARKRRKLRFCALGFDGVWSWHPKFGKLIKNCKFWCISATFSDRREIWTICQSFDCENHLFWRWLHLKNVSSKCQKFH